MPRPLPRRLSSSLPPPPRRTYTPGLEESEADDYFQDRGGRRSSYPRQSTYGDDNDDDSYTKPRRRRAESTNHRDRYRPNSSRDSYHRPSNTNNNTRYHNPQDRDRDDEEPRRGRSKRRDSYYRPSKSLDGHHVHNHNCNRRYHSRSSSIYSSSPSPSSSRSSSTDSSLSSHHYGGGTHAHRHRDRRRSSTTRTTPRNKQKSTSDKYYPPSASRSNPTAKRNPLNRLRSLSLPAVASKALHRSRSSSSSSSRSRSRSRGRTPFKTLKSTLKQDKNKQPPPKRTPSEIFLRAAQCAAEAGAIAALKLRDDPSPWIGPNGKGPKIAAAALSAAAVDTFMEQRHPNRKGGIRHTVMRQVTQMAIGNLVKNAPGPMKMPPPGAGQKFGNQGKGASAGGKAAGKSGGGGGGGKVHTGGGGGRGRR